FANTITYSNSGPGHLYGRQIAGSLFFAVPPRLDAVAFWGSGDLDLREANFAEREVVINCVAIMGGVQITVPPGVEVDVRGFGFMGAFDQRDTPGPVAPGAPRVVVTGLAFWGGVEVKVKPPKRPKPLGGGAKLRKEL
ncbi:LiaF domain-containing protein, partial [Streptomyces roseus]|uniref:LiaF domain-containing protein n=1 Tax=Streptomyces roseus TaxID=66430 RepID=UPI0006543972